MKHSKITVLLCGVLLGSAFTAAILVPLLSANKPGGVVIATAPANQPENAISKTRNVFRGGLEGVQPSPAADPKPSDQKAANPVAATSSRVEVSAMPRNPAQPALAAPAPSSRVSSALPAAQTSNVASLPAPRQVSGPQPISSSPSISSASAPMPGSFSSGTLSDALTIGPSDVVPAALAPPNPAANLTPQQQALADQLGQQFLQAVAAGSPAGAGSSAHAQTGTTAPSGSTPSQQQTWSQNQKLSDAMYKLFFGGQAFLVQNMNAYRQSLQNSGQ